MFKFPRKCSSSGGLAFALGALILPQAAMADADPKAGSAAFAAQCSACHSDKPGVNGVAPSLAGVAGRKAGTLAGFSYTDALKNSGIVWSEKTFDQFMIDPNKMVHGTSMSAIVPDAATRANLYAYFASLKGAEPVAPAAPPVAAIKGPTQAQLNAAQTDPANWLNVTQNYAGTRFVNARQITAANAKRLRPVCIYRQTFAAPSQTSPLVYEGVMYLSFGRLTVAVDAATCREKWTYMWTPKGKEISPPNRGVAIKDGKLVRGTADGYLIALDMASGALLWERQIASAEANQYVSAPAMIVDDLVIMGTAGADFGPKNWLGAFKLATGEPVWRFNLVPDPNEPGADSWKNAESAKKGGGSIWTPLSYDVKGGVLYVPVGNPAPDFYGEARPGDNLYTNSIVALDVKTGKMLWYRQLVPHDQHDSDLSQVSPLFSLSSKGKTRDFVAASGKDGFLNVIDRTTHEVVYKVPLTTHENFDAVPTVDGVHRCPGLLGGMEWNGPAYDPTRRLLFAPAVDWCGTFKKFPNPPVYGTMEHYYGGSVEQDPRDKAKGWLTAINAATGKVAWKYASPTPLVAAVTATAGGVVFTGDFNNNFLALDALNGKVLYSFNTGGALGGGVLSYQQAGRQYVAAVSGNVSAFFGGSGLPTVVVFALDNSDPVAQQARAKKARVARQ